MENYEVAVTVVKMQVCHHMTSSCYYTAFSHAKKLQLPQHDFIQMRDLRQLRNLCTFFNADTNPLRPSILTLKRIATSWLRLASIA